MLVLILSFSASLILIVGMLAYQIILMRKGKIEAGREIAHPAWMYKINLGSLKGTMIEYAKKYGHQLVLILLKVWIKTSYFIKIKKEAWMPKVKETFHKYQPKDVRSEESSKFFESVLKYKAKLKKISKNIKEEVREEIENKKEN